MAKIDSETLKAIDDYYNTKIKTLKALQTKIEKDKEREYNYNFEHSAEVKEIRHLFSKLESKYGRDNLRISCELYAFRDSNGYFKNDKDWIKYDNEICKLRNQRALLVTQLECNPKNSSEYKKAYEEMQKLFT